MSLITLQQKGKLLLELKEADLLFEAKKSFLPFIQYTYPNYNTNWHHKFMCDKLEDLYHSKIRRLIILTGPRHGKSEIVSRRFPAWCLGMNPNEQIVITSYGAELANAMNRDVQRIIDNERYRKVFPNTTLSGENEIATTTSYVRKQDYIEIVNHNGFLRSSGAGGSLTGHGFSIAVIDDPIKNQEEAESKLIRDRVYDWYQSTLLTRMEKNDRILLTMTRWHSDDLAGRILASEESKDWTVITIPSILEEKKNDYDPREVGEALWPWKYPLDKLNKIKTALGPHYWAALYQGSPVARGGTLFKSQNFRYHTIDMNTKEYVCERMEKEPIRVKINELTKHCYVDPAIEIKTSNDPTGMAAWGYSRKYKIWLLLDTISERIEHNCVMDRIKSFASKWDCTLIGIENEKLGKVLVKQSQGNDMIGGKKIPFKEIKTGGVDKYARATPMATYQGNERVFFPKYASWLSEYEDTLVKFPNVGHDEYVDITSMAQHMETAETLAEILSRM